MRILRSLWPLFLIAGLLRAQPVSEIRFEGLSRITPQSATDASGLKLGAAVTQGLLQTASQKLLETGFFRTVNFRYEPTAKGAGFIITLQVVEEKTVRPVLLDIPGVDESAVWQALKASGSLVDHMMPDNDQATAYYQREIESVLAGPLHHPERVSCKIDADLATGRMVAIFRPVNLSVVAGIRFEGSKRIHPSALAGTVAPLVSGRDYTERTVRRIIEFNIRPLYDEMGNLTAAFPKVEATDIGGGKVSVTVTVDEGPVWTLGKVDIVGDGLPVEEMRKAAKFPEGKTANWKQITGEALFMETVLQRDGYLRISSTADRAYRKDAPIMDLTIHVNKGAQFRFGALIVNGLNPAATQDAIRLWKIAEGEPLDGPYIDEYLKSTFKGPARGMKNVRKELKLRPGTTVMDVVANFK